MEASQNQFIFALEQFGLLVRWGVANDAFVIQMGREMMRLKVPPARRPSPAPVWSVLPGRQDLSDF